MTRHPQRGGIPAARRGCHRATPDGRPDGLPDLRPAPGHYLLAGIETVLTDLGSPGERLADELRAALARTAACGDTCRVRPAADAVRLATGLLLAGRTDEATQALRAARAELMARPSLPKTPSPELLAPAVLLAPS
jgi:hypothetical protein